MTVSLQRPHMNFPRGIGTQVRKGSHFLLLTSYESKNALDSEMGVDPAGNIVPGPAISSIALYIPPNALTTTYGANYTDTQIGLFSDQAMQAFNALVNQNFDNFGNIVGNLDENYSSCLGALKIIKDGWETEAIPELKNRYSDKIGFLAKIFGNLR